MKTFNSVVIRYVLYAFPAVLAILVWGSFVDPNQIQFSSAFLMWLWDILGINLMFWIVVTLYLMVSLIASQTLRNDVLMKLARIKERDERESYIAGIASKSTFLSTTAVLICFLFLSFFTVIVAKTPADQVSPGEKRGYVSIGMQLSVIETETKTEPQVKDDIFFHYHDIPITKTGLILIFLLWQIGSYHYFARKAYAVK